MSRSPSLVWIFSFADLAFILVLALAVIPTSNADYAQLKLSEVVKNEQLQKAPSNGKGWRLYVKEGAEGLDAISIKKWESSQQKWITLNKLNSRERVEAELRKIKSSNSKIDFLADDKSQTGAMLLALSMIQKTWPDMSIFTTVKVENSLK